MPRATAISPPRDRRRHAIEARRVVGWLVVLAAVALICNTWIAGGLLVPCIVDGGSMAPTLLGAHRQWQCTACQQSFTCDLASLPSHGKSAVCLHCGAPNDPQQGVDLPGNRIVVDRTAFQWRPPRRWETVVLRSPFDPDTLCVKRIVGLPGEMVEIAGGDVWVDSHPARKDLPTLRAMAVPVAGEARWLPDHLGPWRTDGADLVHKPASPGRVNWLRYTHLEPTVSDPQLGQTCILDGSDYDQNESRLLNPVRDVMLSCEAQATGQGTLELEVASGGDVFRLVLEVPSGRVRLNHGEHPVLTAQAGHDSLPNRTRVEFAVADGRVQFALAGQTVAHYDYRPAAGPCVESTQLALGARDAAVRVSQLRVFRDVYYLADPRARTTQYRLGPQEYFVLGDNTAHSEDSRFWSLRGGVTAGMLVGRALHW